jgi:outer membrane receptor protein involved in Fe transport
VSARYRLGGGFSVRGAGYKSFRAPGLNNLYRSFSSTTAITIANPTLSPERLVGGEVGLEFETHRIAFGATWFEYDTKSLIASYRIPNAAAAPPAVVAICGPTLSNCPATVNFNTNAQDAISRGLELTTSWRVMPSLRVNGGYAYTDSHYILTTTGDPTNVQLGGIPKSLGSLGVSWAPSARVTGYLGARYSSSMYLDVNQTIPQSSFTLLNASASIAVTHEIELTGSVMNATDVRYTDTATTSAAGKTLGMPRAFATGLRWRF